mmetsp:Transcript_117925/g.286064  ORF Transcript_117925/g.286064 Transcript_117925/m.286064 type:complete len:224 (+) Transcript_117925:200-871(+)
MVEGKQKKGKSEPIHRLTVALERQGVAALPVLPPGTSHRLVGAVSTLAKSTSLAASRREAAELTVLVSRVDNPVDTGVVADGGVLRVNQNHLEIFVRRVLVDPVRVEHTEVAANTSNTLLSDTAKAAAELQLVDSVVLGLTVDNSLVVGALASTTAHGDTEDREALLGLVAEAARLVRTSRVRTAGDLVTLAVLPGADAEQVAQHVGLLLLPDLAHVLVSRHD